MAKLDSDDLKAIKDLIEETVDEVIDRRDLVTKSDSRGANSAKPASFRSRR